MISDQTAPRAVAYFGHDVNDAAVRRRLAMLAEEGVRARLGGFRRDATTLQADVVSAPIDFGQTSDARLLQRTIAILRHAFAPRRLRALSLGAQVLVARNLEMLVLASRVRKPDQRLVYECLDIHRLMLGNGSKSRLMRWIERRLLARTDLVIVSSPAFASEYFRARQGRAEGVLLVENKMATPRAVAEQSALPATAPPREGMGHPPGGCTIGWFGMLRCRRTLSQLAAIARNGGGDVRVLVAGKPSPAEFPDFERELNQYPELEYLGPYRPEALPALYARVDYIWAVDYFEEGLNSSWLLPNRLYEGLANGAVPIALADVETGRWLAHRGVGLLVHDPLAELPGGLPRRGDSAFARMREAVLGLPRDAVVQSVQERGAITRAIMGQAA